MFSKANPMKNSTMTWWQLSLLSLIAYFSRHPSALLRAQGLSVILQGKKRY